MTDVLQRASKYRSRLKAELARVEEFLRMAEELSKSGDLESGLPFSTGNGGAKAEAKPAEAEAPAKPAKAAEEAKSPFDRFRAAGG